MKSPLPEMRVAPRHAELIHALDFDGYGGAELFFGDINRDGRPEIVSYQGPGVFGARMYAGLGRIKPCLPRSECVSAFDLDGRRLWTWGEPNSGDRPYISHAYESCVDIGDVDNDGFAEVVVARGSAVVVLDGQTGLEKRSASLPEDYFYIVHILEHAASPGQAALVVKNGEHDYHGGPYGQPVLGLTADLKTAWGPVIIPGAGHHILTVPVKPGGQSGYLIGYCAVASTGRIEWVVDAITSESIDAHRQHVDDYAVWQAPDGGHIMALAGSDRGYIIEGGGRTMATITGGHVQGVAIGRFQGGSQVQAAFYSAPDGPVIACTLQGERAWCAETPRLDETMQPLVFRHAHAEMFHRNHPLVTVPGVDRDWLAYADGGWPWCPDGAGRPALVFAPPHTCVDWERAAEEAGENRLDDMGFGYAVKTVPAGKTGSPLIAIYNRRHVWLYQAPDN